MSDTFKNTDTYQLVRLRELGTSGIWVDEMGDAYQVDMLTRDAKRQPRSF